MEKRMMVNGSNAVPGHRAPADGTARLSGSTQQPARTNGAERDQAPAFGPRTGVAVLAIHSHIRGHGGGPVFRATGASSSTSCAGTSKATKSSRGRAAERGAAHPASAAQRSARRRT